MIRRTMIIFIALMIGLSPAYAAQDYSRRLDSVIESLKKHLAEKKPEFTHRSIEPIKGSRNVSVNNWESEDCGVRVSIIAYGSKEEAAAAMRQSLAIGKKELPNLGDGGYSWGMGGSNIGFRKDDLTIWISGPENAAVSKEFAELVAAAIPAP